MKRVIGVGGVFIKSKDPKSLCAWYKRHLGIDIQDWGGAVFPWGNQSGKTVWSIFPDSSEYFAPSVASFMVNYIVEDLDAVLAVLRSEGCEVDDRTDESEFGKFGWVMDPEGNRIELWQPPHAGS